MTSAKPSTAGSLKKGARSSASSTAPACSKGVAGTQEGSMKRMSSGQPSAFSIMKRMPSVPSTLAISWGSATTVPVPSGTTRSLKCAGVSIELSICTCESINAGRMVFPVRSTISLALTLPVGTRPVMRSPVMSTSTPVSHTPLKTSAATAPVRQRSGMPAARRAWRLRTAGVRVSGMAESLGRPGRTPAGGFFAGVAEVVALKTGGCRC